MNVFITHNKIHPALKHLLALESIDHNNTLESIVQQTQEAWVKRIRPITRDVTTERWDISPDLVTHYQTKVAEYKPLLKQLGLIDQCRAPVKHYRYALFLGGLGMSMQKRLETLEQECKRGTIIDEIIICCSERILDQPEDAIYPEHLTTIKTEADLGLWLIENNAVDGVNAAIQYIHTPLIMTAQGSVRRPTTGDTIIDWLQRYNPEPDTILVLSSQPHCGYQKAVVETYVQPHGFSVEVAGTPAPDDEKIVEILDTLGRWLYQELQKELLLKTKG